MKKKILGLDLGSASIGWALISEDFDSDISKSEIIDLGSRIIPYEGTEGQDFVKGTGESKNSIRTSDRSARRGYDRYQLRRQFLLNTLAKHGMVPEANLKVLPKMEIWKLRAMAANEKVSKQELGRILLLLNQKRGYKSSRSDSNLEKKDTDYVASVKSRHTLINESKLTIGEYFYKKLLTDEYFRIKENIFPREAYIEEYNRICKTQQQFYPELTDELVKTIRDEIIYYQRPLKSQKGLVSICEFEGFYVSNGGKEFLAGPKVIHRSSPMFQIAKIWESINHLNLKTRQGDEIYLTVEEKNILFSHLDNNEKLTVKDLCLLLNINEEEIYVDRKLYKTGIQGNTTKSIIRKIIGNDKDLLKHLTLELKVNVDITKGTCLFSRKSGEVIDSSITNYKIIDRKIEYEPLYKLWHTIYSISDLEECKQVIAKNFNFPDDIADQLAKIDFSKYGYGNKSLKCIRKILPYLMDGYNYSDSMTYAGYNHSGSLTKEENLSRELLDKLKPLQKNSLRQPIVEKILNQMINLVNEIISEYGKPDEIRVELARELKQSKDERNETEKYINKRNRENEIIAKELETFGLRATRNNIIKWRLYNEIDNEEKKLNAMCVYCGKHISLTEAIKGNNVDIEHIIPKSKLFDDSQSNKTLAHRSCNSTKGNLTAYDFMKSKSDYEFKAYIERVNLLFEKELIYKVKRDKLLMTENKIPDNFIDRQLRESQYISKKAKEILNTICHNVYCTSGTITSELRKLWGWEDVTMNLQLPKYKQAGLTETITWESNHGNSTHTKEVIKGWTKRDDHRHHAIDALTIACTKQSYIHKFNTLNSQKTKSEIESAINGFTYSEKLSSIEKYIVSKSPITVKEVESKVAGILVSFKPGKKVISRGVRKVGKSGCKKIVQSNIVVPRGSLSEKSVYGKILVLEKNKPLKYLFENPEDIVKSYIKNLINTRLSENENNPKKAYASTQKNPIYLRESIPLEHASCYKEEYVIKYSVDTNFNKVDKVVDEKTKEILINRLKKFNKNPKEAFKDVSKSDGKSIKWYEDEELAKPIRSVRCLTGLSAVVPVRKDDTGQSSGFVKPGNNHHIAIYEDQNGLLNEHVCTFWHAVERRKFNLPAIIINTDDVWEYIQQKKEKEFSISFLEQLPLPGNKHKLSLQQNEMFLLGLPNDEINFAIDNQDFATISRHLYRVQKIASKDYYFRHHLETQINDSSDSLNMQRFIRVRSINALMTYSPQKVRISNLGKIKLD